MSDYERGFKAGVEAAKRIARPFVGDGIAWGVFLADLENLAAPREDEPCTKRACRDSYSAMFHAVEATGRECAKLNEEIATEYRRGVEDAAKVAERNEYDGYGSHVAACIRALSQPREPTPSHAAPDPKDTPVTRPWKDASPDFQAGYRAGWADREADILCGIDRIKPASPAAPREGE